MSATPTQPLSPSQAMPPAQAPVAESWDWFAMFLVVGVFVILGYVIWAKDLSESNLTLIMGTILGWVTSKANFEWGSSNSSKTKDATIANLTK